MAQYDGYRSNQANHRDSDIMIVAIMVIILFHRLACA